jgi:hypothetical protein
VSFKTIVVNDVTGFFTDISSSSRSVCLVHDEAGKYGLTWHCQLISIEKADSLALRNKHPSPDARLEDKAVPRRNSWESPTINPFCILKRHIDATMTVGVSKIIMPVSAVDGNPGICNI